MSTSMPELALGAVLLLALVAVLVAWFKRRDRARMARRTQCLRVSEILARVATAADHRCKHFHVAISGNDDAALMELLALKGEYPRDIEPEVQRIEALWQSLSRQLAEFSGVDSQTTLQSSVLTNRSHNVARDIAQQVEAARQKLDAFADG